MKKRPEVKAKSHAGSFSSHPETSVPPETMEDKTSRGIMIHLCLEKN